MVLIVLPPPLCFQDDDEVIGFASLPEQVHRKALKRGFDFTLMVVGETGMGKSTLIQSLFLNPNLYDERKVPGVLGQLASCVPQLLVFSYGAKNGCRLLI